MPKRIVAALHLVHSDGEAAQGETVTLSAEDEKRLDAQRALVPAEFDSFESYSDFIQDAYRAGRGDILAANRLAEARQGGVIDLSRGEGGAEPSVYINFLRDESPSADEVIAAVDGDPVKAQAMLEAEREVSGGKPRKGVEDKLTKIIDEG